MSKKMMTKIIAAFAVIAIVIPPLYMGGTLLHLLMIFVAGVGSYEIARLQKKDIVINTLLYFGVVALTYFADDALVPAVFGLWAVILKETNQMIGQCGLTMQPWKDENVLEIGYLFERTYWHKGYAIEAAKACKKYAFEILKADEVCSIIRDTNIASQKVAIRNGMTIKDVWTKHYRGVDMPHYRYVVYH